MKTKRLLAFLLTVLMIGGLLPTVFAEDAAEGDAGTTLVYDFSTAAFSDYATPGTTLTASTVGKYTIDPAKSEQWKYVSCINVGTLGFQSDGLCFYTAQKEAEANSNAIVITMNVPASGTYKPSISHSEIKYGEKTDVYLVNRDLVTAKGFDVTTIDGVRAAIALSSMTDGNASVKHLASFDTHPDATAEDALAESVYLLAGDYYLFVIANEGSVQYNATRTYSMLSKLTLTATSEVTEAESVFYCFNAEAKAGYESGSFNMNTITSYDILNSEISTGAWMFLGSNNMKAHEMYPEASGGVTMRATAANLGNNVTLLKAKLEKSGTYKPSMTYRTYNERGKFDIYFVPVSYADKRWSMSVASLNLTEVTSDPGVKHIISQDGWSSSAATLTGDYDNVYLDSGEYYVLMTLSQGKTASASDTFFITNGITLTPQPGVVVSAADKKIARNETTTVSAAFKDEQGNTISADITYKSSADSVATVNATSGVVTGKGEGTAEITATVTLSGISYSDSIYITVSDDFDYMLTSGVTGGERAIEKIKYTSLDTSLTDKWAYVGKSNIDSGALDSAGLQFRVVGADFGNGGYVIKLPIVNSGIYTPTIGWTAKPYCSIVDTYIVPVAYADAKWTMTSPAIADIIKDSGATLIASIDMSTGEYKTCKPVKLSDNEYYAVIVISALGSGNDSQGRGFGYIKSISLDWVSEIGENVENPNISFGISNNVDKKINVMGKNYTRGDEIELSADEIEGYTFRYWVRGTEESGEIVSTEADFTYELITNTYLTAVYTKDTTANIVEFFGGSGEYIATAEVVDGNVTLPSDPILTGFKFLGWYTAPDKLLSETVLDAAITRAAAVFGDDDTSFTVEGETNLKYDAKITRTSDTPVVWYRDGVRVAYGTSYTYYVWDNVGEITSAQGSARPTVVLDKTTKDGAYMIEYDAGGKSIAEVGILFGDGENMTVDSCKYKATSKKNANHGQFTAKPAEEGYTTAVGYIIYKDGSEYKVEYSE